jgi:hypothetical protein
MESVLVMVFWVVTPFNDVIGHQRSGGQCCLQFQVENGGSIVLRNSVTTLHYDPEGSDLNLTMQYVLLVMTV